MKMIKWIVIVSMLTALAMAFIECDSKKYINAALLEAAKVRYSILLGGLDA